jgi:ribosomal protein S18 acetylase RimI-like enzyme
VNSNIEINYLTPAHIQDILTMQSRAKAELSEKYYTPDDAIITRTANNGLSVGLFSNTHKLIGMYLVYDGIAYDEATTYLPNHEKIAYVAGIYIYPEYRNQGYATKLVKKSMIKLKRRQFDSIWTTVSPENKPSLSLFNKLLFLVKFETTFYNGQLTRNILYRLI